ncbi:MAG: AAA family ATPase [Candidatus Kaiserbacteria bacterium]|nr:AAA family ATPase [Candidatus Kaiserbacteria bacterium]
MDQKCAMAVLQSGSNVFLTGEPGAGKTHTISNYVAWLQKKRKEVAVTASTGIAASHIGGRTIHSWSGIGVKETLGQEDIEQIMQKGRSVQRMSETEVLIIDEVSMLSGKILDALDVLLRTARMDTRPFGGVQIILVGDFFQLPPVSRDSNTPYAFTAEVWSRAGLQVCYLTEQHRQEDNAFLDLLRAIRNGTLSDEHYTLLQEQDSIANGMQEPTMLHAHNREVDQDNTARLEALSGERRVFTMEKDGPRAVVEAMVKGCMSPEVLSIKEGAVVMFTKNDPQQSFVNGTLGTVTGFSREGDLPIIETFDGKTIVAEHMLWEMHDGGERIAALRQVPLRLAWSITIHKSQGASLDAAEINLSRVFVEGQGYVALSRVRSLAGLRLVGGITPKSLAIAPMIQEQDRLYKQASEQAEVAFAGATPEEVQGESVATTAPISKPLKKDTYTTTLEMLQDGKTLEEIVITRAIQEKTILTHIEILVANNALQSSDIKHLLPKNWDEIYQEIHTAIKKHTDERLKPLYEHCDEKYPYPLITLARVTYRLEKNNTA